MIIKYHLLRARSPFCFPNLQVLFGIQNFEPRVDELLAGACYSGEVRIPSPVMPRSMGQQRTYLRNGFQIVNSKHAYLSSEPRASWTVDFQSSQSGSFARCIARLASLGESRRMFLMKLRPTAQREKLEQLRAVHCAGSSSYHFSNRFSDKERQIPPSRSRRPVKTHIDPYL